MNELTDQKDLILSGALRAVSLTDKYDLDADTVFVTGTQALVRLCLLQAQLDSKAGLNTAGFVSGYRGSPLGAVDMQFSSATSVLKDANILFEPGLNEDMAATAVWGTQQTHLYGENTTDGVFAIWYGKGPGVDRTGDVFRHANMAGTAPHGGVIALLGDDHTGESSTVCHQSEYALVDAMMPVLNPANVEEIVQFGLHGWALSRFAGVWTGIKCVKDNIESTASVALNADEFSVSLPNEYAMPEEGLNIRLGDTRHNQEARLHRHKVGAVQAYVRANHLDGVTIEGGSHPSLGIVSTGKSYMDVLQALADLGITPARAEALGLSVYKVGMSWPLEPNGIRDFAAGKTHLLVVEEKRGLIESQMKDVLYGMADAPVIIGKRDEAGAVLLAEEGGLTSTQVGMAIGVHLLKDRSSDTVVEQNLSRLCQVAAQEIAPLGTERVPYFCAGCPHNSSTVLPEGARGYAGIGCHWMAQFMERNVEGHTHMGGEGANWIGESFFSTRNHIFQNIGDGTFNHSGLMAIRAAIASNVNMTYKILYNDAVAMTGGQTHEGDMTPKEIAELMVACGAKRTVLVCDDLSRHDGISYPKEVQLYHRSMLQPVQEELAAVEGVTALIYDQTCATEKRRRRKRGLMPDPDERIFINPDVCEGCGDCGVQSNCVAILPLETELGRKRKIDQSACNKDFSCVKGFCPSFVTVKGATIHKPDAVMALSDDVPLPAAALSLDRPVSIILTGVGGTGVVTIGALLGMAAHLEGKGCGIIDMAGLAQKGGAVTSHIRIGRTPEDISAIRIGPGGGDVLLGCDMLVSATSSLMKLLSPDAHIVVNNYEMPTGDFTRDADAFLPADAMAARLAEAVPAGQSCQMNATGLATSLLGDAIASNLFLLGVAWQRGLVPLSRESMREAIRLNGVAIDQSLQAFDWGRRWVVDEHSVMQSAGLAGMYIHTPITDIDELIADRMTRLTAYQNAAYADRFKARMDAVRACDADAHSALSIAAARGLYKMMAIKDEYEVARLYTDGAFAAALKKQFDGDVSLSFHLAPPLLSGTDAVTGRPVKRIFGSWVMPVMRGLAKVKGLRGTVFDIFGYTQERRSERAFLARYEDLLDRVCSDVTSDNYDIAVLLASIPNDVRGFGPVRESHMQMAGRQMDTLLEQFSSTIAAQVKK